jgi:hypothetical protein
MMEDRKESRRTAVRKMVYVAPLVLSLAATPAFARSGSDAPRKPKKEKPGRG